VRPPAESGVKQNVSVTQDAPLAILMERPAFVVLMVDAIVMMS
jgi:hypothetical protein